GPVGCVLRRSTLTGRDVRTVPRSLAPAGGVRRCRADSGDGRRTARAGGESGFRRPGARGAGFDVPADAGPPAADVAAAGGRGALGGRRGSAGRVGAGNLDADTGNDQIAGGGSVAGYRLTLGRRRAAAIGLVFSGTGSESGAGGDRGGDPR